MVQLGAYDLADVNHIKEATFGTTPTSGAWGVLPSVRRINILPQPVRRPKVGLGRQNPSDWKTVKKHATFNIDYVMTAYDSSPAFDPWTFPQFIFEQASGADGSPDDTLDSFSFAVKLDLATDEYWWLKGCKLTQFDWVGNELDDMVLCRASGIAQWYDYGTTDPVSGSATRDSAPDTDQVAFSDCDILYDPSSPASIMDDISAFTLSIRRTYRRAGTNSTTAALYRAFVERSRSFHAEITKDFDARDELEDFIDDTKTKMTFELPNAANGSIIALTEGYFMPGSELPIRELELLDLRLQGQWATIARSAHG
jgi:hypothetical protein